MFRDARRRGSTPRTRRFIFGKQNKRKVGATMGDELKEEIKNAAVAVLVTAAVVGLALLMGGK